MDISKIPDSSKKIFRDRHGSKNRNKNPSKLYYHLPDKVNFNLTFEFLKIYLFLLMKNLIEKTPVLTSEEAKEKRRWFLLDATDKVLGRFASRVVKLLSGKFSPQYTPHADMGACVIIVNAEKVKFTGDKLNTKTYEKYTGYPSGHKQKSLKEFLQKKPEMILRLAISRMLPKNRLKSRMLKRLHIYAGPNHKHNAQKPVKIEIW